MAKKKEVLVETTFTEVALEEPKTPDNMITLETGEKVEATPVVVYGVNRMKYEKDGCTFIVKDNGNGVYIA